MAFEPSPLPYAKTALEPTISHRTLEFHYDKHHAGYVKKLNELTKNSPLMDLPLEEVIRKTAGQAKLKEIFNNAAQVWNHDFFWHSMAPSGGGQPRGPLAAQINRDFGSADAFAEKFANAALHQFGSGWTWLVLNKGKLEIVSTPDAELPMTSGLHALATCDVWEHAYYLDYQNDREKFVRGFLGKLINWAFVADRLEKVVPA